MKPQARVNAVDQAWPEPDWTCGTARGRRVRERIADTQGKRVERPVLCADRARVDVFPVLFGRLSLITGRSLDDSDEGLVAVGIEQRLEVQCDQNLLIEQGDRATSTQRVRSGELLFSIEFERRGTR